jgi:hypothetical protein
MAGARTGVGAGAAPTEPDLPTTGRGCVAGRAGGFDWWGTGSRSAGISTLPLETNTFAWGLATMTRGGGAMRPDLLINSAAGLAPDLATGRSVVGGSVNPRVATG